MTRNRFYTFTDILITEIRSCLSATKISPSQTTGKYNTTPKASPVQKTQHKYEPLDGVDMPPPPPVLYFPYTRVVVLQL